MQNTLQLIDGYNHLSPFDLKEGLIVRAAIPNLDDTGFEFVIDGYIEEIESPETVVVRVTEIIYNEVDYNEDIEEGNGVQCGNEWIYMLDLGFD